MAPKKGVTNQGPNQTPSRSILLAGGLGGIGSLWAEHLGAEQLLLLGRRPSSAVQRHLEALRRGGSVGRKIG